MKKKVLWLTSDLFPARSGGQMYSLGNIKELNKYVDLKIISSITWGGLKEYKKDDSELKELDITVVTRYQKQTKFTKFDRPLYKYYARKTGTVALYKNILNVVRQSVKQFKPEFIVIDYVGMYNYYRYLKKHFPNIKYVYQSLNAEYLNFSDIHLAQTGINKFISRFWVEKRKEYEHILLRDCFASLCISRYDIEILQNEFNDCGNLIYAKPLIKFDKVKSEQSIQQYKKKLMIVGSMNWYPNVNGILWFLDNVYKELVKRDPTYQLYLVGRNPDALLKDIALQYPNNIVLTGSVESTDPYFEECDISIIPVFEGTGAKIKVLESIGKGIPTICSDFAAKDYDITCDEIVVVEKRAEAYLDAIMRMENDMQHRQELGQKMDMYYSKYFELNEQVKNIFR